MQHPIEKLELHCKYQSHEPLCNPCRDILFDQAIIVFDELNYGSGRISRVGHFYDPHSKTIRMKKLPAPATLIGDKTCHLIPKIEVGSLYENENSDKFFTDTFLEKIEELYTNEIGLQEMIDQTNFRNRGKRKPLF